MKIAIIGGGAAGLTTAYLLDRVHDIVVLEKQPILGGNIRTLGKNVKSQDLPDNFPVGLDNGVIEFQQDHFVNFHKLLDRLKVEYQTINGGSSSLFLANGKHLSAPGILKHPSHTLSDRILGHIKLLSLLPAFRKSLPTDASALRDRPLSDFLQEGNVWHIWQKMLLMYGYSIPYQHIANFPAEIAAPILRQSRLGTRWTRIVGGVYSYMEAILADLNGEVLVNSDVSGITRNSQGVNIRFTNQDVVRFDKVIFATPPDNVLSLLSDPNELEKERFGAWLGNHATTCIHTDLTMYKQYGVSSYSEFDLFQKDSLQDAGYNAYLNRLCGIPESAPHYNLAYNLKERIDPASIVHTQHHQTPLYTNEALAYREQVRATNGENHTYHAGAWLGNGLHEGAINSALAVSRLLGGTENL